MLLALDNCEHLLEACAQVGRHLLASARGLRLLATSREPLSVAAETIWRVPPLSVARRAPRSGRTRTGWGARGGGRTKPVRRLAAGAARSRRGFSAGPDTT